MTDDAKHGTAIAWTHAPGYKGETWNPTTGCSKVSTGCRDCYAETVTARYAGQPGWIDEHKPWAWANAAHNIRLRPDRLEQPLHWTKPRMVFVNSMSDLFHEQLTGLPDFHGRTLPTRPGDPTRPQYIADVFAVMSLADRHVFQVLTKRPRAMAVLLTSPSFWAGVSDARYGLGGTVLPGLARDYAAGVCTLPNVWLGTSIENIDHTDRADWLRRTPAAVRFISAEPLLGSLFRLEGDAERNATAAQAAALQQDHARAATEKHPATPSLEEGLAGGDGSAQAGVQSGAGARARRAPLDLSGIDQVIVGGESGPTHRPMYLDDARELRDACVALGVAFFYKQGSGLRSGTDPVLDGRAWQQYPGHLLEGAIA